MNPYITTQSIIWNDPKFVVIDDERLKKLAADIGSAEMEVPNWRAPVFPLGDDELFLNFISVGNCINFAFTDFDSHISFAVKYKDTLWRGAFAMWACLLRAVERGVEILDGKYLSQMEHSECEK